MSTALRLRESTAGEFLEVQKASNCGCHSYSISYRRAGHFAALFKKTNNDPGEVIDASPYFYGPTFIAMILMAVTEILSI
jgi:hypothetical protein